MFQTLKFSVETTVVYTQEYRLPLSMFGLEICQGLMLFVHQ